MHREEVRKMFWKWLEKEHPILSEVLLSLPLILGAAALIKSCLF